MASAFRELRESISGVSGVSGIAQDLTSILLPRLFVLFKISANLFSSNPIGRSLYLVPLT